jgi:hypothetical protein
MKLASSVIIASQTLGQERAVKAVATGTAWLKSRDAFTTHCIAASRLGYVV